MTKNNILEYLKKHKQEFSSEFGITKLGLFGSYARNEEHKDSDIDLIIDIEAKDIYEKKIEFKKRLEKEFNTKVDIAREKYLKPLARKEILKEVCYV